MSGSSSKMSVTQLTLLTALNMMGSGIIMLPTKLAEVGTFSIVSCPNSRRLAQNRVDSSQL